jgi:hypothetical protein
MATELVQELPLQAGWNAVWLEVTPTEPALSTVFSGTPVDQVAAYFPSLSTVQFISDPSEAAWNHPSWGVWYAPGRPEAALSSLAALDGGRAYLVHALSPATVTVRGQAVYLPLRWTANSLNFVGLPVDPQAPPTFAEFFAASAAHLSLRVYRLSEGRWRPLASPSTTPVERGVAYWIYSTGRSAWQGPLEVDVRGQGGINFGDAGVNTELLVTNRSAGPLAATLMRQAGDLPLCTEQVEAESLAVSYPRLSDGRSLGLLAAGSAATVRLQVRRELMPVAEQEALLSVRGGGCLVRIPVTASRGTP